MKTYYTMNNVGRRGNYTVTFHDGVKTHADGSKFQDFRVFRRKRDFAAFVKSLRQQGYIER